MMKLIVVQLTNWNYLETEFALDKTGILGSTLTTVYIE